MVVKLYYISFTVSRKFESSVISYGSQTSERRLMAWQTFESSVISYGSQTSP